MEEKLRRLFELEDSLARQLEGTRQTIRMMGRKYSKEKGYIVPLSVYQLRREVFK